MGMGQRWDVMMEKGSERTTDPLRLPEMAKRDELAVGCRKNASRIVVPWPRWKRSKRRGRVNRIAFVPPSPHRTSSSARQMAQDVPHVTNLIRIIVYTN